MDKSGIGQNHVNLPPTEIILRMHELDARTKIVIMMLCGCLVILLDSPSSLFVCFLFSLLLIAVSSPTLKQIRLLLLLLLFTTWGLLYSQAIFYNAFPRTILWTLVPSDVPVLGGWPGGINVYREGIFHGVLQSLRFNTTLVIGCYIIWTTQSRELLVALMQLKIPGTLAFMVTTALRFIPIIVEETAAVIRAQRLRGFRYVQLNIFASINGIINSFHPILAGIIRQATYLGESFESRGFSTENTSERTQINASKMRSRDYCIVTIFCFSLIVIIGLKLIYFCYANGIYYASWLRHAYTFTREIL